jgi:hypothetical protein
LWRDFQAYFWRLFLACFAPPRGKHGAKTRHLVGGWGGGMLSMWLGLAHFHKGYSFLMISQNLLDIWTVFFLILSRFSKLTWYLAKRRVLVACFPRGGAKHAKTPKIRLKITPQK